MVHSSKSLSSTLVFYVNGKKILEPSPDPEWTLLYYLRYKLRLCGTKEGCGEGGCGACTVLLSKFDRENDKVLNFAINACLTPLCSIHGCAIVTTEGIGSVRTQLHPVQERIAKSHGTQCGFCTPGFVMSMYALLRNNPTPTEHDLEDAFQGNLCRCTGYRPIVEGFKTFCAKKDEKNGSGCCQANGAQTKCCMSTNGQNGNSIHQEIDTLFDRSKLLSYDPTQDPIFPPDLKLCQDYDLDELIFKNEKVAWYRPATWKSLLELKAKFSSTAKILAGNTELGVEAKFKSMVSPVYIHSINIPELTSVVYNESSIKIGAGMSLTNFQKICIDLSKKYGEGNVFSSFNDMIHWFAGQQIRNVATVGGNLITASPISDLNPIFLAHECSAILESAGNGTRVVKIDEKFFTGYRKTIINPDEVLRTIIIPLPQKNEYFWSAKQSRRRDDDIAIVNTGIKIVINDDGIIERGILAYGGLAPITIIAQKSSNYLIGKKWSHLVLEKVCSLLQEDFSLSADTPGGMASYRQSLSLSFFFKFYNLVTDWLSTRSIKVDGSSFDKSAISSCTQAPSSGSQFFQLVSNKQPETDLVGRPLAHLSALKHATGEAIYIDDMPILAGELFGAIVYNNVCPYGKVLNVDACEALKLKGVVDFITVKDVPGSNFSHRNEPHFADDTVNWIGQTIGFILATDQNIAEKAARLVKLSIEPLNPVLLTIEDAITHNSFHCHKQLLKGDAEGSLGSSEHILEGEMYVGAQEHFYMETQSALAVPKEDLELDVYVSTQSPTDMQRDISSCTNLAQNRVNVKTRRSGGAFGGKETKSLFVAAPVALAALKHRVPVRCVLNRYDDMQMTGSRNTFLFRYKVGYESSGRVNAIQLEIYTNGGACIDVCDVVMEVTIYSFEGPYSIPNWKINGNVCKTNITPNTAFRGFGNPEASVVIHSIFDSIALKLGKSSEEIRLMHLFKDGELSSSNQLVSNPTVRKCWDEVIESSKYALRHKYVQEFNEKNRWKKRGIAVTATKHHIGFNFTTMNQAGALVMIHLDGSVSLNHGGMDMGQGLHTKMVQIVTRVLGIGENKIYFSETETHKVPNTTATCGSYSSDLNGMAIINACEILMERIEPYKKSNPNGKWEDWIQAAYHNLENLSAVGFYKYTDIGDHDMNKSNSGKHCVYMCYGAACSEVEIDCLTGDHTVLRTDIVMDVGESLNPAIDIGQIEGAFVQGYGLFTMEELLSSPKGHLLTRGPGMYKIPSLTDIPQVFNVSILRGASNPRAVYSSKGIGEPPFTLATSIFMGIKRAISAARTESGLSPDFQLDSPATSERIRNACENVFSVKRDASSTFKKGAKSTNWSINV